MRTLAKTTILAAVVAWLASRVLRHAIRLAILAAVLTAGVAIVERHRTHLDGVRRVVHCDLAVLRHAATSSDTPAERATPARLASCHTHHPLASR